MGQTLEVNEAGWLILDAVDRFLLEYQRWEDLQDEGEADYIDARLSEAMDALLAVDAGETPPRGFKQMLAAIDKLRRAAGALDEQGSIFSLADDADRVAFTNAAAELAQVRSRKYNAARNPETVRELMRMEGMKPAQIASMFGLVDGDGRPRVDLVERENINPGSVIGPDNLPKDDVEGWEKPLAFPACRVTIRRAEGRRAAEERKSKAEACPESSYDLFLLSLSRDAPLTVRQAANMLQRTEAEVQAEWEEYRKVQRRRERIADLQELRALTGEDLPELAPEIEDDEDAPPIEDTLASEYETWEESDLRELCKERGIGTAPNSKKATMIAKLVAADAAEMEKAA
jgi:hypothetical protein